MEGILAWIIRHDVYVSFDTWIDYHTKVLHRLPYLVRGDGDLLYAS